MSSILNITILMKLNRISLETGGKREDGKSCAPREQG
jgi:hypothetical protein